ncbi:uncharacterized protein LOC127164517 [Labeo rohita]|uniref:uncharacterized protein LOC127164517 n=1 Tax=Labeo rohita TaxID=84645 RepID=UPI0021E31A45|nr:uncharacterized protein LOC127164517 [Labeo rohita]
MSFEILSVRCSSGVDESHVFISSGKNVRLPCKIVLSHCKSTHWIYNRLRYSATVKLISGGEKEKNTERHERLSVGSDCSLSIKNVTKEDYGSYTCQKYVNGKKEGTDACVHLHVLHVSSSSSSQTEISPASSVTLSCQLYSFEGVSCDDWIRSEGIQLFWVNQAGVKLTISDSRYQESAPGHCISTLNTTLLKEDDNRELRCEVTHRDQVMTSATYTNRSSARADLKAAMISAHPTNSQDPPTTNTHKTTDPAAETEVSWTTGSWIIRVILIILETAVFAAPTVILLQIICARRTGRKDLRHRDDISIQY